VGAAGGGRDRRNRRCLRRGLQQAGRRLITVRGPPWRCVTRGPGSGTRSRPDNRTAYGDPSPSAWTS
jgi:hypothetical protein